MSSKRCQTVLKIEWKPKVQIKNQAQLAHENGKDCLCHCLKKIDIAHFLVSQHGSIQMVVQENHFKRFMGFTENSQSSVHMVKGRSLVPSTSHKLTNYLIWLHGNSCDSPFHSSRGLISYENSLPCYNALNKAYRDSMLTRVPPQK